MRVSITLITILVIYFSISLLFSITETQIILPPDPFDNLHFGRSVDIDGNQMAVGTYNIQGGKIYIYQKNGDLWYYQNTINPPIQLDSLYFGNSVAIKGDQLIIGANSNATIAPANGYAFIYHFANNTWNLEASIASPNPSGYDRFGWTVDISDSLAAISAYSDAEHGANSGAVYIYKKAADIWTESTKLMPNDPGIGSKFGYTLCLDGDEIIINAPYDNANYSYSGSAYIFHKDNNLWSQVTKLNVADAADLDAFGWSVGISGNRAVVGAFGADLTKGAVYIYEKQDSLWIQTNRLTSGELLANSFGFSVSLFGDILLIGAQTDNTNGNASGSAYVYQYSNGEWLQRSKILASNGLTGDMLGWFVNVINNMAMISAWGYDSSFLNSGAVYYVNLAGIVPVCDNYNPAAIDFNSFPNPCKSMTNISFTINKDAYVSVNIYNIKGQNIQTLYKGMHKQGDFNFTWQHDSKLYPSGLYICKVIIDGMASSHKIYLLK